MSKIQYIYFPLDGATTVLRKHPREVTPPGMTNISNAIPARSDTSITIRPNWVYTQDPVLGISADVVLPSTSVLRDVLNSATGIYGSDQVTFFTSYIPYGLNNGISEVLSDTHDAGSCNLTVGSSTILGTSTEFLELAYRGALVRFKNRGTIYTGSPYLWTDSGGTAGEWYLTELDETEVELLGLKIRRILSQNYSHGTVGALVDGQVGTGDNDALSFTTIYAATPAGVNPNTIAAGRYMTLEMATNISGTPYKWTNTADGGATTEYYLTLKAGTVPAFVPDAWVGGADAPEYIRQVNLNNRSYAWFWDKVNQNLLNVDTPSIIEHGTVGSLASYEWALGDSASDSLGFDTIYIANPTGDLDTSLGVFGFSSVDENPSFNARTSKQQSFGVAYYKDVSHGTGNWTWVKSNVSEIHGGVTHYAYYLKLSAGDPGIDNPLKLMVDGARGGWWVGTPDNLGEFHETREYYSYGDSALDVLGYNTIYWFPSEASGYVASGNTVEIAGYHRYVCSNYSWTASANGTNEYYLAQQGGSDLGGAFDEPYQVVVGGQNAPKGTVSSLVDGAWGFGSGAGDATPNTIYHRDDSGDPDTLGTTIYASYQFDLYTSKYKWTEGATSNEWWMGLINPANPSGAGLDPSVSEPTILTVDGYSYTSGTLEALAVNEWDYGDAAGDGLGFDTLYIYATSTPDGAVGTGDLDETKPSTVYIRDAAADYDYFVVDDITSDTELSIVGTPTLADTGAQPTFYYNHNPFRSTYKLNIQGYSEGLIYCSPFTGPEVAPQDISGPFYAGLQQGDWKYLPKLYQDTDYSGQDSDYTLQPLLATNGLSYIQITPFLSDSGDASSTDEKFAISYGVGGKGTWTDGWFYSQVPDEVVNVEVASGDSGGVGYDCMFNSIKAYGTTYLAAGFDLTESPVVPCIFYSTDSYGLTWELKSETGNATYEWASLDEIKVAADYVGLSAAASNSDLDRIVVLYWRASDNRVVVRYSDDLGVTLNDTTTAGQTYITDGDEETKIDYLQGQFVITVKDGIYYGDGTTFTKVAITGATQLKSIAYNDAGTFAAIESPTASVWTSTALASGWEETTLPKSVSSEEANWIVWDENGGRWIVNTQSEFMWTESLEVDPATGNPPWSVSPIYESASETGTKDPTNMIVEAAGILWGSWYPPVFSHVRLLRHSYFWWDIDKFVPISNDYRSTTFSVLQGYTLLIGTSERDFEKIPNPTTETVSEVPTVNGTVKDFTFTLASTGELGIEPESVIITAVVTDGTNEETETVIDNDAGILKGDVSATGTINYDTGACRLVFNDKTVKTGESINAAYNYLTEGDTTGWEYHPRRVRWSVPQTYNDFTGVGSGTADVNGEGAFLDARTVNGRVVVFESNAISTIVPRGDVTDPWDYEQIKANVRNLSNPVVIDDACYFIASDGLLWQTDSINVKETGSAFDITAFDDFTEDQPVLLDYSSALNSLLVYYFNSTASTHKCYAISLSTGAVTSIDLPLISDSGGLSEKPAAICAVSDSSDQRVLASHHPVSGDTDQVVISKLDLGGDITGKDALASSGQDDYWYSTIETGELFLAPEGSKTSLRHIITRSYTYAEADNTNRPFIAVDVKSLEDSSWNAIGDSVGTATMTTTALTGSGTAWSTKIAGPTGDGDTTQACDGATVAFTLPCLGSQARVYLDSTLQTAYTSSAKVITFTTAPGATKTLYAYWENYPEVKVAVGDAYKSSEGFHMVTAISSAQDITLDHYLSTGSETVTHYSLSQLPDGEGETKLGIKGLTEGVRIRVYVIPEYNAATELEVGAGQGTGTTYSLLGSPSIVKITGIIIGHVPQGRKRLEATGS